MPSEKVKRNYAFFRSSLRMTATKSLEAAKTARTEHPHSATQGRLMFVTGNATEKTCHDWRKQDVTYVDVPEDIGLRIVGYADEIVPRRIKHRGWFTDSLGLNGTYRGVVFQLPARKGCAVYLSGYQESDTGGYLIALRPRDWNTADKGEDESYDASEARKQAASEADQIAQRHAKTERDYQDSWRLGSDYAEHVETVRDLRLERRKLVHNLRRARDEFARMGLAGKPWITTLCARLREDIADLKERSRGARAAMCKIIDENPYADKAAFNEGAGIDVL